MKFSFVLILLLGVPHLRGQQRIEESGHILLRLPFPSFYNSYIKSCCKLYPRGCYSLLDSIGNTCELLRGRVTVTERDGCTEFKISNVQFADAGYYRCGVPGAHIYADYYVEVLEASYHHSHFQPAVTTVTTKAPKTSTTVPDPTGPAVAQDYGDSIRVPWGFSVPLAVILSVTLMIVITSVIGVVCCRVKAKRLAGKNGETSCESLKPDAPETNGIVYTTVDFRAHRKPEGVYENLKTYAKRAGATDEDHAGMVEYSMVAINQ
ncbi:uncharacterized protein LOC125003618 [Mugil cephalus]|uniref:uncharacterized protein LOC125003618 n=1 Tax=Mugil cephalus TaxID=48193 RepID=UPI001FB817C2|nr:uncharacterized protein LOC125003618 [Mugil cephalus]